MHEPHGFFIFPGIDERFERLQVETLSRESSEHRLATLRSFLSTVNPDEESLAFALGDGSDPDFPVFRGQGIKDRAFVSTLAVGESLPFLHRLSTYFPTFLSTGFIISLSTPFLICNYETAAMINA